MSDACQPPAYRSSRFFPAIAGATDEEKVASLLANLYQERRDEYGLDARPEKVFLDDVEWFSRLRPPPAAVLECGAGTGTFAAMLARRGYTVTAADIYSEADWARLQESYSGEARLRFARLEEITGADERFDAVVSISVLEHLQRPDETLLAWRDLIKPGGTLTIVCPNYSGLWGPLRLAGRALLGRKAWRYASGWAALGHALENLCLNARLLATGESCFVRCWPVVADGVVHMSDADMDAVHLPSARGLANFLRRNCFELVSWRGGGRTLLLKLINTFFPGLAPTVRIHARRELTTEMH